MEDIENFYEIEQTFIDREKIRLVETDAGIVLDIEKNRFDTRIIADKVVLDRHSEVVEFYHGIRSDPDATIHKHDNAVAISQPPSWMSKQLAKDEVEAIINGVEEMVEKVDGVLKKPL